jgi:cytidyltransferase-like protein
MTAKPVTVYVDIVADLFHAGHVSFFRQARQLGDRLVVGIVSDDDVATYKPRPILSFAERLAIVSACRFVDEALPEPAPLHCTPEHLDRIGADFVCHGDDMTTEDLEFWYSAVLPAGRLRTVPYTPGISSRDIIERVVDRLKAGPCA